MLRHFGMCLVIRLTNFSVCFFSIKCKSSWTTTYSIQAIGFFTSSRLSKIRARLWLHVPQRVFICFMPQWVVCTPILLCHLLIKSSTTGCNCLRYHSVITSCLFAIVLLGRTCKMILFFLSKRPLEHHLYKPARGDTACRKSNDSRRRHKNVWSAVPVRQTYLAGVWSMGAE